MNFILQAAYAEDRYICEVISGDDFHKELPKTKKIFNLFDITTNPTTDEVTLDLAALNAKVKAKVKANAYA